MNETTTRPRTSGSDGARSRRIGLPLLFGVVVVALLGLALWFTSGDDDPAEATPQTAPVEVDGEALPAFTDPQTDPAVGQPAPALHGTGFDGDPSAVEPGQGPLVVIFAAHWCPHCQREVAELSPWLAQGGAEELGVEVVAVSTGVDDTAPNYPPSAWFEDEGWPAPVLLDDDGNTAADAYGLSGYPFFAFVNADGIVVGRMSGSLGVDTFETVLQALIE